MRPAGLRRLVVDGYEGTDMSARSDLRGVLLICAALALFGFIHSVLPSGGIYLPWDVPSKLPWQWAAAYSVLAIVLMALSRTSAFRSTTPVLDTA